MSSVVNKIMGPMRLAERHFYILRNVVSVVLALIVAMAATTSSAADLENGVNYLTTNQNASSGTWGEFDATGLRETAVILETLSAFGQTGSAYYSGRANISGATSTNTDMLARKIMSLVAAQDDVSSLVADLYAVQDVAISDDTLPNFPGRGWGIAEGFSSDVLDTALALRALKAAGESGAVSVAQETVSVGGTSASYPFDLPAGASDFFIFVGQTTGTIRVNIAQPGGGTSFVDLTSAQVPIRVGSFPTDPGTWTLSIENRDTVAVTASVDVGFVRADGFDTFRLSTPLSYLGLAQNADGGWGIRPGEESSLMITAEVLQALHAWQGNFGPSDALTNGVDYLLGLQNADGGFSSTPGVSNINETAMAMQAIGLINASTPQLSNAVAYLDAAQLANGSWNDDSFSTALALRSSVAATPLAAPAFTGNGGAGPGANFVTDLTTIVLEGTAPVGAADLSVNVPGAVIDYDSANGTYQITVDLAEGLNNIVISTVNGFGQVGGSTTVEVIHNSALQGQAIDVRSGLNPVGISLNPANSLTAIGLLELLGENAREIHVLNELTGTYSKVKRDGSGGFIGSDISLSGLEGVDILADGAASARVVGNVVSSPTVDLVAGPNHLIFPDPPSGLDAFTVLSTIGDETVVSSIRRFNADTGAFETAMYSGSNIRGINFPIEAGISYLVSMRVALAGFVIPTDVSASIAIISPLTGTTAYTSPLTVSGTVSGQAPLSVTVNGVAAVVTGGTFTVDIPLSSAGSVPITATLVDGDGRVRTDSITINYEPVDYVIPIGGNVSDNRGFSFPTAIISQIAFYSQTNIGVPPGVIYTTTNFSLFGDGTALVDYDIAIGSGAAPGVHTFQIEYSLLDANSNPLGPLTGNIFTFKILITP